MRACGHRSLPLAGLVAGQVREVRVLSRQFQNLVTRDASAVEDAFGDGNAVRPNHFGDAGPASPPRMSPAAERATQMDDAWLLSAR